MPENTLFSKRDSGQAKQLLQHDFPGWLDAEKIQISNYWNGDPVPGAGWRMSTAISSLWSDRNLFLRFECTFDELNVDPGLGEGGPIDQLWEWDVVEAFIRPQGRKDYFEIEVSPLGQWLDVHILKPRMQVDFSWRSQLTLNVKTDQVTQSWTSIVCLPFAPMLGTESPLTGPELGDIWRINFFRAAGKEPGRHYLTWRPTRTPEPDFHVPAAFGNLLFVEDS